MLPALKSLDGERLALKESSQQVLLAAVDVPEKELELPESRPWLEGVDWDKIEGTIMKENFLDNIAEAEGQDFEESLQEAKFLENKADELLAKAAANAAE